MARAAQNPWRGFRPEPGTGEGVVRASLSGASTLLLRPLQVIREYPRDALRADLVAGATVGVVLLPQALAFSLLAGLPPVMGLYSAMIAAVAGALWGSSSHLHTGPTNTSALLTLSVLLSLAAPGSPRFIAAAGLLAVLSGLIRLILGLARLGMLVNFVSDSVAVGFTAGAGLLIISNQLPTILNVSIADSSTLVSTMTGVVQNAVRTHFPSLILGLATIAAIILAQRLTKRLPAVLVGIVAVAGLGYLLGAEQYNIKVLGELPRSLPPIARLPLFDLQLVGQVANGALALAIIGLVEATSIARAVAGHSRQRVDSNQEFVGQGVANILAGIFSGYPCSGSFNRSALSFQSGARTSFANAFSGLFLLLVMFVFGPLAAHLPRAVLAGALVIAAWSMIDRRAIMRIWRSARAEAGIMIVTLIATLILPLQFAVLAGVLMSLGLYLLRTSTPRVLSVVPSADFRHWDHHPDRPNCPQVGVLTILGDMYFGAVNHIEECINASLQENPTQKHLLLRMANVQRCDISGIRALESTVRTYRDRGGGVYFVGVREPVMRMMRLSGFYQYVGAEHFLTQDEAIDYLFHKVLDPAICIYECPVRVFKECQNLPKREFTNGTTEEIIHLELTENTVTSIAARDLWRRLRDTSPPMIVDVREPREYKRGHIPFAELMPLAQILSGEVDLSPEQPIVLACRSGRRSLLAAAALRGRGYTELAVLQGGMQSWEAANLLEAVD